VTFRFALTLQTVKSARSSPVRTTMVWSRAPRSLASESPLATCGFALYSIYALSGFANDWSLHFFGTKAYLSAIALVLLPLAWLFSGNALRGLRATSGLCWAAFLMWMLLATPLSVWRAGSAGLLLNYVPRAYLAFFYTCAFVTSFRRCRQWMFVQIASAAALLLSCFAFGGWGNDLDADRFRLPDSLFFANSNDLALALLLGIGSFLFLFHLPGRVGRFAGAVGILLSTFFLFRTGSRGSVIGASAMLVLILVLSRNKWKVAIVGIAALGMASAASFAVAAPSTLHRLSLLMTDASAPGETEPDASSVASQRERGELFRTSLQYTFSHPLLGVGPDQFATAVEQDAARANRHAPWLGTHNTYTQISSECGIPALIFYVAVIGSCLRSNFRLYRRTRDLPPCQELAGLSLCLLASVSGFAVSAFFFHMAYGSHVPALAGLTVALQLTSIPLNQTKGKT
jgi:O-antigen ligase